MLWSQIISLVSTAKVHHLNFVKYTMYQYIYQCTFGINYLLTYLLDFCLGGGGSDRLCSFGNAKVGEAKVAKRSLAKRRLAKRRFIFYFLFVLVALCPDCVAGWQAKVHTNIFEKAKIGEQNNLIMGNKYGQTIIF